MGDWPEPPPLRAGLRFPECPAVLTRCELLDPAVLGRHFPASRRQCCKVEQFTQSSVATTGPGCVELHFPEGCASVAGSGFMFPCCLGLHFPEASALVVGISCPCFRCVELHFPECSASVVGIWPWLCGTPFPMGLCVGDRKWSLGSCCVGLHFPWCCVVVPGSGCMWPGCWDYGSQHPTRLWQEVAPSPLTLVPPP